MSSEDYEVTNITYSSCQLYNQAATLLGLELHEHCLSARDHTFNEFGIWCDHECQSKPGANNLNFLAGQRKGLANASRNAIWFAVQRFVLASFRTSISRKPNFLFLKTSRPFTNYLCWRRTWRIMEVGQQRNDLDANF